MIPKTMKAAVIIEFCKPLQIEEVEAKTPKENQILVKIIACGVCYTDLHAIEGDWPVKHKMPLIPGHERVGYVVAVDPNVKNVKEGDLQEAIGFTNEEKVISIVTEAKLEDVNEAFDKMIKGQIEEQMVLHIS